MWWFMNENAIRFVIEYIDMCLPEPQISWPDYIFNYRANERWAANEILDRLYSFPMDPPDMVVEGFLIEMLLASRVSQNEQNQKRFEIAKEVAEDILCSLV